MTMVYQEELEPNKGTFEVRTDGDAAVFVRIQGRKAEVYPTLADFIQSVYFGQDVTKFTCEDADLDKLYHSIGYDFESIRKMYERDTRAKRVSEILDELNGMNLTADEARVVITGIKHK